MALPPESRGSLEHVRDYSMQPIHGQQSTFYLRERMVPNSKFSDQIQAQSAPLSRKLFWIEREV